MMHILQTMNQINVLTVRQRFIANVVVKHSQMYLYY
ncbi:Uncharacterised protein [Acinetobacter baumannii]|nr:Uncharacterised protein [Acinetobacter baumannii]